MLLHCLQHVAFEDAAGIGDWAARRGHTLGTTRFDLGQSPPRATQYDWLVILGGPMNVYETDRYPWLTAERAAIREAVDAGKPVLGVCLGAQLIADVLGARVTRNAQKEIGWWPVWLTAAGRRTPLLADWPERFEPFHWHGDTFGVPPGAALLASSEACTNQAFLYGDRVLGLQFHVEYTACSIDRMLRHCGDELVDGPYIQPAAGIVAAGDRLPAAQRLMERLLDGFSALVSRTDG